MMAAGDASKTYSEEEREAVGKKKRVKRERDSVGVLPKIERAAPKPSTFPGGTV